MAEDWIVNGANTYIFQSYDKLIPLNGSGDTSYAWVQFQLYLIVALTGCILWSLLDHKRSHYNRLSYWFRIIIRYFIIIHCFGYGISKLFSLQMLFPSLSQMATPLGDFLPMRLSWLFMGYSTTYQSFTGVMEILAGVLLLFRKTSTFGTLLAAGVFANVMLMNLSYDIPVKIFSMHLFIMCLLLLVFEYKRIFHFFLNQPAAAGTLYHVRFLKKWMRVSRIVLKCLFIVAVFIMPFVNIRDRYESVYHPKEIKPIRPGMYDVQLFVLNGDTIPLQVGDTLRWKDVIFEKGGAGSVNATDTMFRQRYRRGYFNYSADTVKHEIIFKKSNVLGETFYLFRLSYEIPDSATIRLHGMMRKDSIFAELKRSKRHFQLAERQFHWLSEYNR